jgi:hypothetical protein
MIMTTRTRRVTWTSVSVAMMISVLGMVAAASSAFTMMMAVMASPVTVAVAGVKMASSV